MPLVLTTVTAPVIDYELGRCAIWSSRDASAPTLVFGHLGVGGSPTTNIVELAVAARKEFMPRWPMGGIAIVDLTPRRLSITGKPLIQRVDLKLGDLGADPVWVSMSEEAAGRNLTDILPSEILASWDFPDWMFSAAATYDGEG